MKLTKNQKSIRRRLIDLIYREGQSHIGSAMSAIDMIDVIYSVKQPREKFVLSNGHAAAALYTILDKFELLSNPSIKTLGVHPDRLTCKVVDFSTGSLGQGLPAAIGMALANRDERVYCMISDGECAEGSIWEALRLMSSYKLSNLFLLVNVNGWGAYDDISSIGLLKKFKAFIPKVKVINGHDQSAIKRALSNTQKEPTVIVAKTTSEQLPFLKGLDAHYYTMNEDDYKLAMNLLK